MASPDSLLVEQDAHVLLVTLNRPDAANSLNLPLLRRLAQVIGDLCITPRDVRCVVITGAGGKIFCGGGDMKERQVMTRDDLHEHRGLMEQLIRNLQECPAPVIAAVSGTAVGGGCELVLAMDFAYGSENARFSLPEVKLGMVPGGGATQTLPRASGVRRAKELILTGDMFSADEAMRWGLLNSIFPLPDLLPATLEVAHRIAGNAPLAVSGAKKAISVAADTDLATGLRFELQAHHRTAATKDRAEGLRSLAEKRAPVFRGE